MGRCLPTRSEDPHSESEKPGAPSSATCPAIAGGCAEDPCCRSAGTARLPRLRPAGGHRLADAAAVASPWQAPRLTTHRLPTRTGQLQSPHGRQAPGRGRWAVVDSSRTFDTSTYVVEREQRTEVRGKGMPWRHAIQNSMDGPCQVTSRGRARFRAAAASHQPPQALRPGRCRHQFSRALHLA